VLLFVFILLATSCGNIAFAVDDNGPRAIIQNGNCINGSDCQVERHKTQSEKAKAVMGANWELTNPVCISLTTILAAIYIGVGVAADYACINSIQPTTLQAMALNYLGLGGVALAGESVLNQISVCIAGVASNGVKVECCLASFSFLATLVAATVSIPILYGLSQDSFQNTTVCKEPIKTQEKNSYKTVLKQILFNLEMQVVEMLKFLIRIIVNLYMVAENTRTTGQILVKILAIGVTKIKRRD
jgi:hypothetical protein